ncbi:lipopolysaccharide biosynthesis protein [Dyadobacter chenhuakuii]|uniref:Oligosaccharide flippase family protein n=1 Tax=Dyadobacter chenhuakuii TaxID=2909339 RepID=A0A9X1TUB0_9BACT|nr:oligosaccharide flippase family protein [Dyadobacter chenhuakuii]MCF2498832.1 oligosaccharide flippase family protein [Dyadobacter chenhuakuii]
MLNHRTSTIGFKKRIGALKNHPLFRNSLLYVITDAINKAVPFLILPLLTYYLLPADYGIVANYNVYVNFLVIFIGISVQSIISVNFYKLDKSEIGKYIFNIFFVIAITLSTCGLVIFLFNKQIEDFLSVGTIFVVSGLAIGLSQVLSSINLIIWRLEERPLSFGSYQISQTVCDVGISLVLITVFDMGWRGRLIGIGTSSVIYGFISIFLLWKRGYLNAFFNKNYIKEIFGFCLPLVPHALSIWARAGSDRLIVSNLAGVSASGIYAAGFQFGLLISFLTLAFNNAYAPFVYKSLSIQDEHILESKKQKLVKFTYIYIVALLGLTFLASLVSDYVIDHFLSAKYADAKIYVGWALFSQAFQGVYLMYASFIFFVKRSASLAIVTFLCSSLQVALSYYFVKNLGPIGAAYSNFAISVLNSLIVMVLSAKVYPMPWLNFRLVFAR